MSLATLCACSLILDKLESLPSILGDILANPKQGSKPTNSATNQTKHIPEGPLQYAPQSANEEMERAPRDHQEQNSQVSSPEIDTAALMSSFQDPLTNYPPMESPTAVLMLDPSGKTQQMQLSSDQSPTAQKKKNRRKAPEHSEKAGTRRSIYAYFSSSNPKLHSKISGEEETNSGSDHANQVEHSGSQPANPRTVTIEEIAGSRKAVMGASSQHCQGRTQVDKQVSASPLAPEK
ncbi:hypothetical protein NDU88_001537 [Pleurodeles waltl]|uniref:Uncharacterized protein n=1 Tax=Pleurodeles waltl TaxID=8319 RepID=A0AAV7R7E4_PLEWA|nr:hypothetical protein NDU88_001537 [Pleurodeles waltl]